MHEELVSYIQTNHAADGIEVRAVGPKAVTLALPPELHDAGNLIGELEITFNARVDLIADPQPGLGYTAIVWVMPGDDKGDDDKVPDQIREEAEATPKPAEDGATSSKHNVSETPRWGAFNPGTMIVAGITLLAAVISIASHGAQLLRHFDL